MFIHASMIHIFMNICMVLNNSDKLYTIEFGFTRGLCLLPIFVITLKSVCKNSPTHHRLCWGTSAAPVLPEIKRKRRLRVSTAGRGISGSGSQNNNGGWG